MRKFLIDRISIGSSNRSIVYLLAVLFVLFILGACQSQPYPQPEQTVEVTTEILPPTTPSPTPACTALQPGMSLTVHALLNQAMIIQLKGFKPGERVDITGNTLYEGNGGGFEISDQLIGPDGNAYDREGYSVGTGAPISHWHFQVTYTGGVACTDIDIP
ncbi:MAG: hypothetical protein P4L50_09120 [Anaerolineaceae bacterium]|nr:hypothetical protein [Anaerolineaceae bacterium]